MFGYLRGRRRLSSALAALLPLLSTSMAFAPASIARAERSDNPCHLQPANGDIKHVINIVFDNTHFTRDNPSVPSDLEQMPHLLNFIQNNGTLGTNHHTSLISHTANGILTSLTGVYGDRHGNPVSNSFRYFNPDGTSNLGVSFAYWTAPIFDPTTSTPTNTTYNMLTAEGKNAPAPWVPFTRAGCDFGAVSTANVVLENTGIDIPTVFGPNSPEAREVKADPSLAFTNYVGIAVHCAQGSAHCSQANNGRPDLLPDEPGGYKGFNGLFGHKSVAPQISDGPLTDLNGSVIKDARGRPGFPGFDDMPAATSLSYIAAMQEHGIPVTYGYISDAHDKHSPPSRAYGPGEAGYVQTLREYDEAFAKFFDRLAADGINKSNALFVFTSDEGDHFVGGTPSPSGCDGVTVPCTYSQIGEVNVNTTGLLADQKGVTAPFKMHADVAPTFYLTGNPDRTAASARTFTKAVGELEAVNPYTGNTEVLTEALADPVEMKLLHMITADPTRTPTFTMFAQPDFYLGEGPANCARPCVTLNPRYAYNHGTFSPDIVNTWMGMVGPGVRKQGETDAWSDHADLRPTVLSLVGLRDDYASQGRVLFENLKGDAVPSALRASRDTALELGQVYKQINAPVGELALDSLLVSTRGIKGDGETYDRLEGRLAEITARRDALAAEMAQILEGAAFRDKKIDRQRARSLIQESRDLLSEVKQLAGDISE